MPTRKVIDYLDRNHIQYETVIHSPTYTAMETAASAHISGKEMAKTVMIKCNGKMAMAVLPASYKVDFEMLRKCLGTEDVVLAHEDEFENMFPDCEVGAMPPFGNIYNMEVFVARSLAEDEEIAFTAGVHGELLKIKYKDYENMVHPKMHRFSYT